MHHNRSIHSRRSLMPVSGSSLLICTLTVMLGFALAPCTGTAQTDPPQSQSTSTMESEPFRIILLIGDGVGTAHWTAALLSADSLNVCRFGVGGLVDTRAEPEIITDSAASATALACGIKTYNKAIGVDNDGSTVESVTEIARRRGWATGLVVTSSVTHATPAAFAAHVPRRAMEVEIAAQMANAGLDVLLGGGRRFFERAEGPQGGSALEYLRATTTYVETEDELLAVHLSEVERLIGFFSP